MDTYVTTANLNGIAVIRIDHPPVNALSTPVIQQLAAKLDAAPADPDVRAIVLVGSGRTFVAGADIKELERAARGEGALPEMHGLLDRIEDSAKPIVMAIHGMALGAGLELAMAGHYRVAARDARMGQPEVNLGIIPGAGGTQRLPRLVGVAKAIHMCVTGTPIGAEEALRAGLIDRIVEGDLTEGAVAFAREIMAGGAPRPRTRERRDKLGTPESNAAALAAGRETARRTWRNMQAPLAAVDAIEAAVSMPFDDGRRRERELVEACLRSDQSKALMHAFFAERAAARAPDVAKDSGAAEIGTVAIIGAGTMGIGIATACAGAGLQVVLIDVGRDVLDRAMAGIQRNVESAVRRGRVSPDEARRRMERIAPRVGYDACDTADLVIEAVYENLALKKQVFAEVDAVAKAACVLATNTSTLDVDEIASATRRPPSVVGMHFFSPAHVMRLLEIVRGRATGDDVLATAQALARRLGKVGVVVRNSPGFAGNRIMFPYMYEAQFLVEEGATPEQVDRVLTDWGMAMGIFAVDDLAGLDVAWRVRQELRQFETPGARKPLLADTLVEMGRLGQKTGKGWYRYGDDRRPIPDPEVLALIERVATRAGIPRREIADQEILERTIYALINEGARVLDEGVARRSSDIDVIYLTGYGFPAYRGGPMFYADTVGLGTILDKVRIFHHDHGVRWAPAPLLARLAAQRTTFAEFDAARP